MCRRSPVLARQSAWVRPDELNAARSASAARFRRRSGSGSDHGCPRAPRPGTRADPRPGKCARSCATSCRLRFCRCPCSRSRPPRGMMQHAHTAESPRTGHGERWSRPLGKRAVPPNWMDWRSAGWPSVPHQNGRYGHRRGRAPPLEDEMESLVTGQTGRCRSACARRPRTDHAGVARCSAIELPPSTTRYCPVM
jgi:hypothetical protein